MSEIRALIALFVAREGIHQCIKINLFFSWPLSFCQGWLQVLSTTANKNVTAASILLFLENCKLASITSCKQNLWTNWIFLQPVPVLLTALILAGSPMNSPVQLCRSGCQVWPSEFVVISLLPTTILISFIGAACDSSLTSRPTSKDFTSLGSPEFSVDGSSLGGNCSWPSFVGLPSENVA